MDNNIRDDDPGDLFPEFEIAPKLGIKAFVNKGGSISLSQDNQYDKDPQVVVIEADQVDTVISWLQALKPLIEG
jgi:hypothetical protein